MRTPALISVLLLSLIPRVGVGQTPRDVIERRIDSLLSEYDARTPGVAVVVVRNGQVSFAKGYGMANLEYETPITPRTVFHVASVSKQFTAFAIYLLSKDGKLSLDDDIRRFIPELPDFGKPIRIRHLLAHTSGLRDQWAMLTLAGWQMEDVITTEQIVRLASRQRGLNFATGSAFGYSNTGYTLLAEAVKRISGMSFAEFARANIFTPLGMHSTFFYDDFHKVLDRNRAYSYERVNGQFAKRELHYSTAGATSLMTTAEDLAKWVNNFANPVVGDVQVIRDFNAVSTLDAGGPVIWGASPGDTTYHAKGQVHYKHRGASVISHGGHDAGFRAVLMRFPEHNLAVITLSNNEHYTMLGKVLPIAELYLADQLEPTVAATGSRPPARNSVTPPAISHRLADFAGDYRSEELSTEYRLEVRNGKLIMTHPRLSDVELTATGNDRFSGTSSFAFEMRFLRRGENVVAFEISNFGAKNIRFDRR